MNRQQKHMREQFALAYVGAANFSGKAAALAAGYAEKGATVRACKLLQEPDVQARIDELLQEQRDRHRLAADAVLLDLRKLADVCMQLVPVFGPDGKTIVGMKPVSSSGASKTLELLGRSLALFVDRRQEDFSGEVTLTWQQPITRLDDDDVFDARPALVPKHGRLTGGNGDGPDYDDDKLPDRPPRRISGGPVVVL